MMFYLFIALVALATAIVPFIAPWVLRQWGIRTHKVNAALPVIAATIFLISFYLPDIHISSETSTFQQHFVGGGIYCVFLYEYFKQLFGWKLHWGIDFIVLFAWVSAFGVANKLLEFFLLKLNIMQLDTSDAYWDLLANTLGAYAGYVVIWIVGKLFRK